MKHSILAFFAVVFLTGTAFAAPALLPEYYLLIENESSSVVHIEVRAGASHSVSVSAHGRRQLIFRAAKLGSGAASFRCGDRRHNVLLQLNTQEPTIHFTIHNDCATTVRYGPEPKG